MSDRDIHDWLLRQVPRETMSDLDARVLEDAGGLLAGRRRRTRSRRVWRPLMAAAAALAIAATLFVVLRPARERVAEQALTLGVDAGVFKVAAGARFIHELPSHRLRLLSGEAVASSGAGPLEVAFPGGVFHVASGEGRVTVQTDGADAMKTESAKTGTNTKNARNRSTVRRAVRNGAVVAVVLFSGIAWLEMRPDAEEIVRHDIAPGERIVVETERSSDGVVDASFRREPAVAPDPTPRSEPAADAPEPAPPELVPLGSEWRYLDRPDAPPEGWREREFDDADWSVGRAELGFGDGDEATVVDGGPDGARRPALFFRKRFEVADPAAYVDGLILRVRRDDGAIVHLNGAEVFRTNMPAGEIDGDIQTDTLAASTVNADQESALFGTTIDPARLVAGENVLAVQVHQAALSSSDLSFDLELRAGTLEDIAPFRGRVVDADTGEPIAGARVAWARGWVTALTPSGATQTFRIVDRDRDHTTITASPLDSIVAETGLWLPFESYQTFSGDYETGGDGEFALREPAPGERLRIEADGFMRLLSPPLAPTQSIERGARWELARPHVVRGTIRGEGPMPIGNPASVHLEFRFEVSGANKHVRWRGFVDDELRFEQALDRHVDSVTLTCSAPGFEEIERTVSVASGEATVDIVLPAHSRVSGRVVDAAGAPIERAELRVSSREHGLLSSWTHRVAYSAADGSFVANVFGPQVKIEVFRAGYAPVTLEDVSPDGPALTVTLLRVEKGIVEGRIVDSSRQPLAGVDIRAIRETLGTLIRGTTRVAATSDEDGRFRLEAQPATWTLVFHLLGLPRAEPRFGGSPDMALVGEDAPVVAIPFVLENVEIREGAANRRLDIVLPNFGAVAGTVTGEDGAPVAGRRLSLYAVNLLTAKSRRLEGAVSDADGRFEFRFVRPGMYAIFDGGDRSNHMVTVKADQTAEVTLGGPTSTLRATVTRDGRPLKSAPVVIGRIEKTLADAKLGSTSDGGGFVFESLRRGLHIILVTDPARMTSMLASVDIDEPEVELEIVWPETVLTVTAPEPLPESARVVVEWLEFDGVPLAELGPRNYRIAGEARGDEKRTTFTLEGVVPGRYRVLTEGVEPQRSVDVTVGKANASAVLESS